MIQLDAVSKVYSSRQEAAVTAVDQVSLKVNTGEFIVITGRSGSGKTTLLNLAAGLTRPTSGTITLAGADLWSLPDVEQSRLRNQKVGFIFQFPSLISSLRVLDNLLLPSMFSASPDKPDVLRKRAEKLLATVGLEDKLRAYPRQLSAGQQQRVVIARALLHKPQILFADEPTSNLDERTEAEIMALFKQIHAREQLTILLVTHSSQLVAYGTRSVAMIGGKIAA